MLVLPRLLLALMLLKGGTLAAEELVFGLMSIDPFYFQAESGELTGLVVDNILSRIKKHADFELKSVLLPAKRFYKQFHDLDVDFSTLPLDRAAYPNVIFGDIPMTFGEVGLFSLTPISNFRGLSSLPRSTIGLRRGLTFGGIRNQLDAFPDKFSLTKLNSSKNIFRILELKRVDYVVEYVLPNRLRNAYPYQSLLQVHTYVAVSKNHPNAQQLVKRLDDLMREIMRNENLTQLY